MEENAVASSSAPLGRRARLVSAAAFACAAWACGLAIPGAYTLYMALSPTLSVRWLPLDVLAIPISAGFAAGVVGFGGARQLAACHDAGDAAQRGAGMTLATAFLLATTASILNGLASLGSVEGFDLRNLVVAFGIMAVLAVPALPFGAAAGWWVWRRAQRAS